MNFEDVKRWVEGFSKQPCRYIIYLVVFAIALCLLAYLTGFFGEKGKEHASSLNVNVESEVAHKQPVLEERENHKSVITQTGQGDQSTLTINQQTQGNQSPAIVSGGDVNIEYNSLKNKK